MKTFLSKIRPDRISLSLAGTLLGTLLAAADFHISPWAALFLVLAVISLQWESMILTIALSLPMIYFSFGTLLSIESFVIVFLVYFLLKMIRGFAAGFALSRNRWKEYAAAFFAYVRWLYIYLIIYVHIPSAPGCCSFLRLRQARWCCPHILRINQNLWTGCWC